MIRMNLAVLSIVATMAWIITGLVHAAAPLATPVVGATTNNTPALWHGIDSTRRKPVSSLRKRTPKQKPERISWPEGATEANLLIKFHDELKVRLDVNGQAYSRTGHDMASFNVVLEGLQVSLQPVYNVDPLIMESIINRAELHSGEAQPDLSATYYVVGTPRDMDGAGMVLLKDPRVEWAKFTRVQQDPREAVAQRKQDLIDRTVASIRDTQGKIDDFQPANKDARTSRPEVTSHPPANNRGLIAGLGACCLTEDDLEPEAMFPAFPVGPTNPEVIKLCDDENYNATSCADADGKFGGEGTQCTTVINDNGTPALRFFSCNANAAAGAPPGGATTWIPVGACCTVGDCDVVPQDECEGIWLDDWVSRFRHDYHPLTGPPVLNTGINPQFLGSLYGYTNFITRGPFGGIILDQTNSNYTYYNVLGLNPIQAVDENTGAGLLSEPRGNNNYAEADLIPGNYARGNVDFNLDTRQPAWENAAAAPGLAAGDLIGRPSGGFTYGGNSNATGLIYNPNWYISCTDFTCQFGVCAMPCWDPDCDLTTADDFFYLPSSLIMKDLPYGPFPQPGGAALGTFFDNPDGDPLYGYQFTVPRNNVTCANFIHEQACDQYQGAFQDLLTGLPEVPVAAGCLTDNGVVSEETRWFQGYFDPPNNVSCGTITEWYVVEPDVVDELRGTCYFGHQNYPTMIINQYGALQIQGAEGCYGRAHSPTGSSCPTQCNSLGVSNDVCGVAPSCCSPEICGTDYGGYVGWSFFCADLANQFRNQLFGEGESSYYTDFDQQLKFGGPFPQLNPLGITAVVARDINGQPIIDPDTGLPTLWPGGAPPKCQINYGVQNQCLTPFFSPYQPTLSDREFQINGGEGRSTRGGCHDFECCHRVCTIVEPDPATGFDYRSCCASDDDSGWVQACVDKAMEICYYDQNGVYYDDTPDFTPLQFNLSQNAARGISQIPIPLRRLATAPMLPPSIISPIPGNPDLPADNWVQSVHQVAWVDVMTTPVGPPNSAVGVSVSGQGHRLDREGNSNQLGLTFNPVNGLLEPDIPGEPQNWDAFYYGNPPVMPIAWYGGQGLSLYGNTPGQPWSTDPGFLSPSFGLYSWGQHLADLEPGYHPWGPYTNGTRGAGTRIAVIDMAAWVQEYIDDVGLPQGAVHEDLGNVILEGPALGFPEVEMLFDPFVTQPQRGTAVLGTIGAGENGFGVTGIATQAQLLFFPTVSASTGLREITAWVHAIESLGYGDVLIASYPGFNETQCLLQPQATGGGDGDTEIIELIALAEASGITVVLPAGDTGSSLDDVLGEDDPGAILAGASLPSNTPHRYWSSNYSTNPNNTFNPLVPVASASAPITTTGGDCNLTMTAINTADDNPLGDPSGYISRDTAARSYTNNFGAVFNGSKAAAAQVAAVAACLQGFSLQRYGIPQSPENIRRLLWKSGRDRFSEPGSDGDTQGGVGQNPVFGGDGYQFDLSAPVEEGAPEVGGYLDPANAGVYMVIDPEFALDSSEYLYDFKFIRGIQQFGMIFSLQESDDQYLIANSEPTARGNYTPDFEVPGSPIKYLSTGDYTDLYIQGVDPNDRGYVGNRTIQVEAVWPDSSITEVYMYSYTADRWMLCPSVYVNAEGVIEELVEFQVNFAEQFFGSDGYWHARVVTHKGSVGPGSDQPGGGVAGFIIKYDLFDFTPSGPQGGQDGTGGEG